MAKDKRYTSVKKLIDSGHFTEFNQIFDVLPKSVLYKDLGMNNDRFTKLMNNVELFILNDIFRIANLLEVEEEKMLKLIYNQYKNDSRKASLKKKRKPFQ